MKKFFCLLSAVSLIWCAAATEIDWKSSLRKDHPRLYLNADTLPVVRDHARSNCAASLNALRQEVNALPDTAQLTFYSDRFREKDGKLTLNQPWAEGFQLVKSTGAPEAVKCALVWLLDGDRTALRRGIAQLRQAVAFFDWCRRHRILTEWHCTLELNALVAYDWLYNGMTPEERKELGKALLENIAFLQPGGGADYHRCHGGPVDGNYGVCSLAWFAGLLFRGEGFDDPAAEKLLNAGFANNVAMMEHRDRLSAGSGLLSAATQGYSFGMYPYATFHFLHTMRSAAGIDWANRWSQMRNYPNWFDWMKIPGNGVLLTYGIGDMAHGNNRLDSHQMYTHMAQTIHFYPEKAELARQLIAVLPEKQRRLHGFFPFLPFILTGFSEQELPTTPTQEAKPEAAFFPAFGLVFSRSGNRGGDTYAMFRAGARYGNHQHYDENSFVIFKHDFLALDAGSRTKSAHHCMFAPQSVAHNTVLIHMDNEPMPPFWKPWGSTAEAIPKNIPCHGGQYKTTGAKHLAFRATPEYTFAANDATGVYRAEKCRRAVRRFVHLQPDLFVIFDQIESVKPEQAKEYLLHVQNEPVACGERTFRADSGKGRLFQQTLLPRAAEIRKVGGRGRQFEASGRNWPLPGGEEAFARPNYYGQWRLETVPSAPSAAVEFLHVLEASDTGREAMVPVKLLDDGTNVGVEITGRDGKIREVLFDRNKLDQLQVISK